MKRIILFFFFVLFSIKSYCQSLSFKDIVFLTQQESAEDFLTSKSLVVKNNKVETYTLNEGTDKEEKVFFTKKGVLYDSFNKNYVSSLTVQIRKQFKLIIKNDNRNDTFYQFGDASINIMVNVNKGPHVFSSVSMAKRP